MIRRYSALILSILLTGQTFAQPAQPPFRVGIIYHGGGKFDGGFNENAYQGTQRAAQQLGVVVKDFEAPDPSQIGPGLRAFANDHFDLTISLGVTSAASVHAVAREFPHLHFGLTEAPAAAPNIAALVFQQEQAAYLLGYLAASQSATGVIAFVGGMDIPLLHRFQAGYRAGALAADANVRVLVQYLGTTPEAWNNPGLAKEVAGGLRARGADILFTAAGASGNGVIDDVAQTQCLSAQDLPNGVTIRKQVYVNVPRSAEYLKRCASTPANPTTPLFFIGVDRNQNHRGDTDGNPETLNHGLSSLLVRADLGLYRLIQEAQRGQFKGGTRTLGLKEGGVDYALDVYNRALIPSGLRVRLETLRLRIMQGKLTVPNR